MYVQQSCMFAKAMYTTWRWVLACALIIAAGTLVAALAWIVVFALMALRDRLRALRQSSK